MITSHGFYMVLLLNSKQNHGFTIDGVSKQLIIRVQCTTMFFFSFEEGLIFQDSFHAPGLWESV